MTADEANGREYARRMIGAAFESDTGRGGIARAFDQLETKLRQPYAQQLTEEDRDDIRQRLNDHVNDVYALLTTRASRRPLWTDDDPDPMTRDIPTTP